MPTVSAVYQQLSKRAKDLEAATSRFLSDMVRVPSFSGKEKGVCHVIKKEKEMEAAGFDEVRLDGLGNVAGWIGRGPRVIAFDTHIVVSVGDGVILENAGLTLTVGRQGDPVHPGPDGSPDRHLHRAGHGLKDVEVPLSRISIPPAIDPVLEEVPR